MKKFLLLLISLVLFGFTFVYAEENLATNSKNAILVDTGTGTIIFEKNKDDRVAVASLTKKENTLKIRKDMSTSTYTATQQQHRVVLTIIFAIPVLIILAGIVVWNLRRRKR